MAAASQHESLQRALPLDAINRVSYLESRCYMLNTLLRDADFMSMSQGLEVRVPLIDHRLAKAVLALPGAWKAEWHAKKTSGRGTGGIAARRNCASPQARLYPAFRALDAAGTSLGDRACPGCEANSERSAGRIARPSQVQQIWQDFLQRRVSWSRPWSLYVLQRWCELHLAVRNAWRRLGGLRRRNQQKQPPPASEPAHQRTGKEFPHHAVEPRLKSCRGLVQQQIPRTEYHAHFHVAESIQQLQRLVASVCFRPRTLQVIEHGSAAATFPARFHNAATALRP